MLKVVLIGTNVIGNQVKGGGATFGTRSKVVIDDFENSWHWRQLLTLIKSIILIFSPNNYVNNNDYQ